MDLPLPVQSEPITTTVVSLNPAQERYKIQHYVIKFVSYLRQIGGFLRVLRFPPPIKLTARYNWNIVESGVKQHKPNQTKLYFFYLLLLLIFSKCCHCFPPVYAMILFHFFTMNKFLIFELCHGKSELKSNSSILGSVPVAIKKR